MKTCIKTSLIIIIFFVSNNILKAQHSKATGFKMPALNPSSPLAGISGNHVGICVPDYAAAIKWYTEKLDFRIVHEWDYAG